MPRFWVSLFFLVLWHFITMQMVSASPQLLQTDAVGDCLQGMGGMYFDPQEAKEQLARGFAARETAGEADRQTVALCGAFLGLLHHGEGALELADTIYQDALAYALPLDDPQIDWTLLFAISAVHIMQSDFEQAEVWLDQAVPHTTRVDGWVSDGFQQLAIATTHNNYAYIYFLEGRINDARDAIELAETNIGSCQPVANTGEFEQLANSLLLSLNGTDLDADASSVEQIIINTLLELVRPVVCATILNNVGEIDRVQGRYAAAYLAFNTALEILQVAAQTDSADSPLPQVFMNAQISEGVLHNNIGLTLYNQQNYSEALRHLREAQQRLAWEQDPREASVYTNMGAVSIAQGDYAAAEASLLRALEVAEAVDEPLLQADSYAHLGNLTMQRGHYPQALEYYEQARLILQESNDPSLLALLLSNLSIVYQKQGLYEEAMHLLDEAAQLVDSAEPTSTQIYVLNSQAALYHAQGVHQAALTIFSDAYRRAIEMEHLALQAGTLNNRGAVYRELGQYRAAQADFDNALQKMRINGDVNGQIVALNNRATVQVAMGEADVALETLQSAETVSDTAPPPDVLGQLLNNRGAAHQALGNYALAEADFQEALALYRSAGNRFEIAQALNNLATLALARGAYGPAFEHLTEARDIADSIGAQGLSARTVANIATAYKQQGRLEEAAEVYQSVLAEFAQLNNRIDQAVTYQNLAGVYIAQGAYGDATSALQTSRELAQAIPNPREEARALSTLAALAVEQGNYIDAHAYLDDAQQLLSPEDSAPVAMTLVANRGAAHHLQGQFALAADLYQQAAADAEQLGIQREAVTILGNLGVLYERQEQFDQALESYEQAMTLADRVRAGSGSESGRITSASRLDGLYEHATRLYVQLGRHEEALRTSERGRARAFFDVVVADGVVQLDDVVSAELLAQERTLFTQRQKLQNNAARARAGDAVDQHRVANLEAEIGRLSAEYDATLAEIEATRASLLNLIPLQTKTPALADIQAQLSNDETLLSYYMLGNHETIVFVITQDRVQAVELGYCCSDFRSEIAKFYAQFNMPSFDTFEIATQTMQTLYGQLIQPITEMLETGRIGIVPHGVLHYVPFSALVDENGDYWSDRHQLYTLPSLTAFSTMMQERPSMGESVLILSNPDTEDLDPEDTSIIFGHLDNADVEAEKISSAWSTSTIQLFASEQATETQLDTYAADASIIQIIAHGNLLAPTPYDSFVAMTPANGEDGLFTVAEVYDLQLHQTDLVVLSACETGLEQLKSSVGSDDNRRTTSPISNGDDIVALNRAFLAQDVSAVVSTLWVVDDAASAELMSSFHRYLSTGDDAATALRQAQIDVRQNPDENWGHPYYWSGYVLAGNVVKSAEVAAVEPTPAATATVMPTPTPTVVESPMPTMTPISAEPTAAVPPPAPVQTAPTPIQPSSQDARSVGNSIGIGAGVVALILMIGSLLRRRR